ncbi:MAG: cytochrome b [Rhodocyclaceae bacterium]|nr:cytochrome b [Rhodocyclaceae bacterium]
MSAPRYTRTAIVLHWLIALLIFGTFPLGLYMADLHLSPLKLRLFSYHKWIGISVLLLAVLRLLWRATHRPPPLVAGMPRWQQIAAHATHHLLYLLVLIVPLSGWLMSSALGVPVVWFGVLPLPDLIGKDKALGETLKLVHEGLNYTLLAVVAVHVAGAVKHQLIDRDGTLARMLPFLAREKT